MIDAARWLAIAIALAGIVTAFHHFSGISDTTVALTMLLLVLLLAGNWGLRYAVGASIAATFGTNASRLPPADSPTDFPTDFPEDSPVDSMISPCTASSARSRPPSLPT